MEKIKVVLVDVGDYDAVYFRKNFPLIAKIEDIEAEVVELTSSQVAEEITRHADATIVVVGYGFSNQSRKEAVATLASALPTCKIVGLIFHIDWKQAERDGCVHIMTTPHSLAFWLPEWLGFKNGADLKNLVYGQQPYTFYSDDQLCAKLKAAGVTWN